MEALILLLIYGLSGAIVIGLGVVLWLRSAATRKTYRCPKCGEPLAARDLVPLFSWIANRGRCRFCEAFHWR